MLDIFVCEDNAVQRQTIVQSIQNTVLIEELDMQLVLDTDDPYVLLEKIRNSRNTGIYFLDIDLGSDINGMKLAQLIRLYDFPVPGGSNGLCTERHPCRSESKDQAMPA